jgi:3-oxoadipate enol-lactonase
MPIVETERLRFHCQRAGNGAPLLFISGTGADLRNTPNVFDGPLPKAFDVLAYDQRGLGQSEKPDQACTMADYADDAAAVMAAHGWDSAHVIGVSFGGMVAQELVLRHPARVRRLVLACTSAGGEGGASFPFHTIDHLEGEARARHLLPISDRRMDAAWATANPDLYKTMIAMSATDPFRDEPGRREGARRQLAARAGHDCWERLGEITAPTLIAAGRHDGIATPENQLNLALRIVGSRLRFFDGGHLFMLQDRRALKAMMAFLAGAGSD